MDIDEVNIDEDITENLEEDTKYKITLDAPQSEPAFDDSGDEGLDAFADAPADDADGFAFRPRNCATNSAVETGVRFVCALSPHHSL